MLFSKAIIIPYSRDLRLKHVKWISYGKIA